MEHGAVYNETTEPEGKASRLPPFCFRFSPAGGRRPGPAVEKGAGTTAPGAKAPRRRPFGFTVRRLWGWRLLAKAAQAILSFVAVLCEEIVDNCSTCGGLYFFEFISCSAFLLSLLILCVYCTDLYESLGEEKVQKLNFWAVPVISAFFLLASIAFSATCSGSAVESAACAFGFFATFAFAAEFGMELFARRKQNAAGRPQHPGNPRSATENQPLNKKR